MSDVFVCGADEVGWGSIAGPLVVAGVTMPDDVEISPIIKDSKKFSSDVLRKKAYEYIVENYQYDYRFVHPNHVRAACLDPTKNAEKIKFPDWGTALHSSMSELMTSMCIKFSKDRKLRLVVDGNSTHGVLGLTAIPKADSTVAAVAAASIIAKVKHDEYMVEMQELYEVPYGWARNKGYGTPEHIKAMNEYGVSTLNHRFNIQKVMDAYNAKGAFV